MFSIYQLTLMQNRYTNREHFLSVRILVTVNVFITWQ